MKKVLFTDLDGALIDTISGNTFPKGIWDMQFKWDVLNAIKGTIQLVDKQQLIDKAESVCAEMFLRIESELFNVGVKNTNNRKEIEDTLEIGYKYFKQAMKGE